MYAQRERKREIIIINIVIIVIITMIIIIIIIIHNHKYTLFLEAYQHAPEGQIGKQSWSNRCRSFQGDDGRWTLDGSLYVSLRHDFLGNIIW